MKDFYGKNKNTLAALVIIIIGFFIYYTYFGGSATSTTVTNSKPKVVSKPAPTELERLQALAKINGDFFKDPLYTSLKDSSPGLPAEPSGRSNPFAPTR